MAGFGFRIFGCCFSFLWCLGLGWVGFVFVVVYSPPVPPFFFFHTSSAGIKWVEKGSLTHVTQYACQKACSNF